MNRTEVRPFGELLREYRVAAGLTQESLAERARMSRAAVAKLEQGTRQRPYPATIALLAGALSLSASDRLSLERAALRGAIAPLESRKSVQSTTTLPVNFSMFIGRDKDVAKVREMLAIHHLVSLVGAGGVGKTRLAVHVAECLIRENANNNRYDDIWFVDLAPIIDRETAVAAIGASVGMERCRTFDMLLGYLRAQRFLLIVDNCEHLLDDVAELTGELLRRCPNAQILATSRQPLRVDGERIYRVPALGVPMDDIGAQLSLQQALEYSAIRLFADRAQASDSRFDLTESNISAVVEICRRLDGIPLAVELTAARVSAFSVATLAQRLGTHFLLFTGETRGALSRHKTMRTAFDWSYGLLNGIESAVFRGLSIFVGGFTLELATSLWAGEIDERVIVETVASLVEKSLVQCDAIVEPARYKMLEPARQYALGLLGERGEKDHVARAHAKALLGLAESFDSRLELIPDPVWEAFIERERGNFRAAFAWSLSAEGDAGVAQRLAGSKTATRCGFASGEVRKWISGALEACNAMTPPKVQANLALIAARSAINFEGPEAARAVAERALELQQPGDLPAIAAAQYLRGAALYWSGQLDEANCALREALVAARISGAEREYYSVTQELAVVSHSLGRLEEAQMFIAEALRLTRAAGADQETANATLILAEIEFTCGRSEDAVRSVEEAADFFRVHANPVRFSRAVGNLSAYLIALGRYEEARHHALEMLRYSRALSIPLDFAWAMQHLAAVLMFGDDCGDRDARFRRAAGLLGFVDEYAKVAGLLRIYTEQHEYDKMIAALREALGAQEVAAAMAEGKTWSEEQAVAEVVAISAGDTVETC